MTIDLNIGELEYLSNHLTPEECRRLVAAAHFKTYMQPNALDEAENTMPKDLSCLELLLHWNGAEGEGKGETHEALEHRLRQMNKYELADWLGKTVFHQLGNDMERSMHGGWKELENDTSTENRNFPQPTLEPKKDTSESSWNEIDSIAILLLSIVIIVIIMILVYACSRRLYEKYKDNKNKNEDKPKREEYYEMISDYSTDTEASEDKFDVRDQETTES